VIAQVAQRFAGPGIVFKIDVHNAKDIQPFSYYGNMEGELLALREQEFVVTRTLHTPDSGPLRGCRCIELQQIPDETLWS
jgi:hypothetical protein